jgi:hypothetical protein
MDKAGKNGGKHTVFPTVFPLLCPQLTHRRLNLYSNKLFVVIEDALRAKKEPAK